jgi:6-phosphogluconate dehydrogenase
MERCPNTQVCSDDFGVRILYHTYTFTDYDSLCKSLSSPRLLVFSLPHGNVGDKVLEGLTPHLSRNDIILDCGNEHFANTERRQEKVKDTGIRYIGCGVSGGYQAARAGPSMCPGGDQSALQEVLPLLEKVAAKDKNGKPCVGIIGKGGSGHYVKMVHNGIEHGMMSAICEAWGIMRKMGMGYEEIGEIFTQWNSEGELVSICVAVVLFVVQLLTSIPERHVSHLYWRRPLTQARTG